VGDLAEGYRLDGRVALITGAGQGIGRATAEAMSSLGAKVAIADIDAGLGEAAAAAIVADGGKAIFVSCDVTSQESAEAAVAATVEAFGPVTVAVNNAGGGNPPTTMSSPRTQWDAALALNLGGAIAISLAVWQVMADAGGGVILNASSQAARRAMEGLSAYCTAKAGIAALTRSLAFEGGPLGIRSNCVAPGWVLTPAVVEWFERTGDRAKAEAEVSDAVAIRRLSTPEDMAKIYCYLASDNASYITGAELWADGGTTLG
jgi:NAD(P)-dependent dehydrogenase (short-subunit alcohol dehydrogenase family)